jgi:hypothetical protein
MAAPGGDLTSIPKLPVADFEIKIAGHSSMSKTDFFL